MKLYYSATTREFYDSCVHQTMPDDAVKIGDPNAILATQKYVDDAIREIRENFALINSPAFTGTPTTPTADKEDCSEQVANTAFVQAKINQHIGLGNMQVFDKDGEFTVPENCTRIKIRVWGGGGGGSFMTSTHWPVSGAGGGYAEGFFTVVPESTLTVTVGDGGSVDRNNEEGGTGGTSKVGSLISATGGNSYHGGPYVPKGGVGQGGDWQVTGSAGQSSITELIGDDSMQLKGGTGGAAYGSSGGLGHNAQGSAGMTPGGGGASGGVDPQGLYAGGDGGDGLVIIEY